MTVASTFGRWFRSAWARLPRFLRSAVVAAVPFVTDGGPGLAADAAPPDVPPAESAPTAPTAPPTAAPSAAAVGAVSGAETPPVRRGETRRFLVQYEDVVRNEGTAPLLDVRCDALLPLDGTRQHVRWLRLSPHGWELRTDEHGQRVASATVARLEPGEVAVFSWIASVDLAEESHAPRDAAGTEIPDDVRRYLADSPLFGISSPVVEKAADDVLAKAPSRAPLAIVRAAAAYVREKITYARRGGWDPAPVVLARGDGSCSETTYAFAAICRRLGVPVRWTGGTLLRRGGPGRALDRTFHRIAEAWVAGHGWLPVETTRVEATSEDECGIPLTMLQLGRGDGSGDAGAGASYFGRTRWASGPAARSAARTARAVWLAGVDDRLVEAGTLDGLGVDEHPSFGRAQVLACDAGGFGPALRGDGTPFADTRAASRPAALETARRLLGAGHPEGVRLALAASRTCRADAEELLRAACDEALLADVLPLLGGRPAQIENWWAVVCDRVLAVDRGRLRLAR